MSCCVRDNRRLSPPKKREKTPFAPPVAALLYSSLHPSCQVSPVAGRRPNRQWRGVSFSRCCSALLDEWPAIVSISLIFQSVFLVHQKAVHSSNGEKNRTAGWQSSKLTPLLFLMAIWFALLQPCCNCEAIGRTFHHASGYRYDHNGPETRRMRTLKISKQPVLSAWKKKMPEIHHQHVNNTSHCITINMSGSIHTSSLTTKINQCTQKKKIVESLYSPQPDAGLPLGCLIIIHVVVRDVIRRGASKRNIEETRQAAGNLNIPVQLPKRVLSFGDSLTFLCPPLMSTRPPLSSTPPFPRFYKVPC